MARVLYRDKYLNNRPRPCCTAAILLLPPLTRARNDRWAYADLLRDDRFPMPQRYLRKIYDDPMTNRPYWGTLHAPSGGIMGVYSLSAGKPFKTANFKPIYESFARKQYYIEWIFAYTPENEMLGLQ